MRYPLAVLLKHGKVNMELITSEGGESERTEASCSPPPPDLPSPDL